MKFLAELNSELLTYFPPGIKIILKQFPLSDYSLLISFFLTLLGLVLLIMSIRYNPGKHVPEGLKKKRL